MKVTYDEQVDAVYCYLSDREAARTIQVSSHVLLDLDSDWNLRGISILGASRVFPAAPYAGVLLVDDEVEPGDWPLLMPMAHAG
jgi:uncharacterized protein YuzE